MKTRLLGIGLLLVLFVCLVGPAFAQSGHWEDGVWTVPETNLGEVTSSGGLVVEDETLTAAMTEYRKNEEILSGLCTIQNEGHQQTDALALRDSYDRCMCTNVTSYARVMEIKQAALEHFFADHPHFRNKTFTVKGKEGSETVTPDDMIRFDTPSFLKVHRCDPS